MVRSFLQEAGVYDDLGVVGIEVWTVNNGTIFDNILITDDPAYAEEVGKSLWSVTAASEQKAKETWEKAKQKEREERQKAEKEAQEKAKEVRKKGTVFSVRYGLWLAHAC